MFRANRRDFLADVGRGMLAASLGASLASELQLAPAWAAEEPKSGVTFGDMEPLVDLLQETPADKLLPQLVAKIKGGLDLKTLTAAAAFANARAFGGNDYTGYHTFMALAPAYQMSLELPKEKRALPVLKVIYRNASRIQETGHAASDTLQVVTAAKPSAPQAATQDLRDAIHRVSYPDAESVFAAIAQGTPGEAFQHLQWAVMEEVDVHRVVLAWRSWAMLNLTGQEHAHTLLRQSVRYCVQSEEYLKTRNRPRSDIRTLLPKLLDEHQLLDQPLGTKPLDDAAVEQLSQVIFAGTRAQAAEAAASALGEGISPAVVGEAISLAANQLVLHDPGRTAQNASKGKPPGGVHGDSVGVHASDSANAWRNIAAASGPRNAAAALIVGAFHTAGQMGSKTPYPYAEQLDSIREKSAEALLAATDEAIRGKDQARACALVQTYGDQKHAVTPLSELLLRYATSEDGALHAEKYYRTVSEEFATTRPAYRWRQMIALARVTASEYGFPAPGYQQACELLGVT
ncbi:hypothetical protein NA78x_001460 [Anatilimnocola sp. NA78]|uniref:hypothetical protein n=1 Tax=Anatilimnocola sp. NA78 TaxID=3415683 RepID=UPI003CE52E3F